jgi:hypothetical protein
MVELEVGDAEEDKDANEDRGAEELAQVLHQRVSDGWLTIFRSDSSILISIGAALSGASEQGEMAG